MSPKIKKPSEGDVLKKAEELLKEFMGKLGVEAEWKMEFSKFTNKEGEEKDYVDIKIEGEDLGILIGYLGRNLRSIQKIFGMILNRTLGFEPGDEDSIKVVIDVSGYREKRQESLENMAGRIRDEVLAASEPVDLPFMTAYERRVIHLAIKEYDDVVSESFGEGSDRHVRISPAE